MNPTNSYVKALFGLANELDSQDISNDVRNFLTIIDSNQEIYEFLKNPLYDFDFKVEVIDLLKEHNFSNYFSNFLKVIILEKDCKFLKNILIEYKNQELIHQNIIEGIIYTTQNLNQKKFDKKVKFINQIDPKLISGIKIMINDSVYDYSIDQKLKLIQKELLN